MNTEAGPVLRRRPAAASGGRRLGCTLRTPGIECGGMFGKRAAFQIGVDVHGGASTTDSSREPWIADPVAILRRLLELLEEASTVDEVCRGSLGVLVEHLDLESASIWLLDPSGARITLEAVRRRGEAGLPDASSRPELTLALSEGPLGRAAAEGVATSIEDPAHDASLQSLPLSFCGGPLLVEPIRSRDRVLGVLCLSRPTTAPALPSGPTLVEPLARAVGQLVSSVRTQQDRMRERYFHYERLAVAGQIAASTAHEVNNILTNVLIRAQQISRREDVPADVRESARMVETDAERIGKLENGLLHPARARRAERRALDLNEILSRTLELTEPLIVRSRRIRIETDLAANLPKVLGEPGELELDFANLLLNAVQAMPRGGALKVYSRAADTAVLGGVVDTGTGIPREALPRLFEPFFTTRAMQGGSGLGLAIVKEIVEGHGGRVEVETLEGVGTEFRVRLPALASPAA